MNLELPKIQKLKLNLRLNQINFFYDQPSTHDIFSTSERINKIKILQSSNNFVNFITENIYKIMPRNFLENFKEIEKKINSLNWPKNPKVIMTSYSHFTDEVFCIYTAKKIKEGAKFVILQHGHQGHHDFCGTYYEKRVCDKYLTWGNKSKDKKTIPLFVSTVIKKNIKKKNPSGILLKLTEFTLIPWKANHSPREIEGVTEYRNNLTNFLSNLEKKIKKKTTIKSYDFTNSNYVTKEIKKNFKEVKINKFNRLIGRGYVEARDKNLIIETFNSTGFLELLTMNSPVILITTKNLFHIKKEYSRYYDSLIKNKIIFFDPKEAAKYINLIYLKIDEWWFEKKRQKAIEFFCENMCRFEKNQMKVLPKILKKISNESKNV